MDDRPIRPLHGLNRRLFCAGLAAAATTVAAQGQQPEKPDLKFSLDWLFQGTQAPMVLAADGGLFKAEGLNVTVDRGAGSGNTINRIVSGAYEIGFADLNSIIKYNADNPGREVTAFYMVFDQSPLAVMSLAEKNIAAPRDLNGKKLGAPVFDGARQMFPVFARQTRLDAGSISWTTMDSNLRETMLVRGDVDAISGFITSSPLSIEARGVKPERIRVMKFADHGLDFYGSALFARADFIAQHPRTIAAFARAMNRALKESLAQPDKAITLLKQREPTVDTALELRRLRIALDELVATPAVRRGGLSVVDPARLERNIAMVCEGFGVKVPPKAGVVFTDRFLPPAAERMLPT
jgi:NitT/TauT family transport system substrate-binding protein